ncbi:potassium transporter TrkG [Phycisphaera mikurensis]|uniref:potassium transporter TrkG n=1 Tax=Phycisphaera mikurensis TaxID=547188 RepID=UPI0012B6043F|nr:potassium transporter TrkG [Phycisphaera mikurensis]MBB6442859.1 trk system potassium uptake protein TrkH [Phycisphaera mikurensis]
MGSPGAGVCTRTLGLALGPLTLVATPTLAIAWAEGALPVAAGLLVPMAGGALGWAYGRRGERSPHHASGPTLAAAWAVASLLCAAPFLAAGGAFGPLNALFESASGLTSTGLSVAGDPRELPLSLQWWRSTLQWIGGVGILYFALTLACVERAGPEDGDDEAADGELGSGEAEKRGPSLRRLLERTWIVYGGLTLLSFAGLYLAGMSAWDAANHAQTAAATGGFSTSADSLAAFGTAAQAVACVTMLAGAVGFGTLRLMTFGRRPAALAIDPQARWFAAALLPLFLLVWASGVPAWPAFFEAASGLATAGFTVREGGGGLLPIAALPLALAMLVGASAGSTGGGLKLARLRRLVRAAAGKPDAGHRLAEPVAATRRLAGLYAAAFALGTLALGFASPAGVTWVDAAFEAASALGTVGLSSGFTDAEAPAACRVVLVALMWVGRLEVVGVLALLAAPLRGGAKDRAVAQSG